MDSILNKQVSFFNTHSDTQPRPVNVLEFLKDKNSIKLQNEILSCVGADDKKSLKAFAKCIAISGLFTKRCEAGLIAHSGLIAVDIDLKDNQQVILDPDFIRKVCVFPWIAYFGKSISGNGYWGIVPILNPNKHKEHFAAIQSVFKSIGITIDPAPSNVASLRYQSYDESAYYNHNAKRFTYLKATREPKKEYQGTAKISSDTNPFNDYNLHGDIESLLISHGWKYSNCTKSDRKRFTRPGKQSGVSADFHTTKRTLYLFSSDPETGLETANKGYSPVSVFAQLECNNNWSLCATKLKALGFGKNS